MKEVMIKVYEFSELDKATKEMLIEREKEIHRNLFYEDWLEFELNDYAKELLQKYFSGAELIGVRYDFSYSQGSGAMIEFETKHYKVIHDYACRYEHENSFSIVQKEEFDEWLELLTEEEMEELRSKIYDMNREFTKGGYSMIENCIDDETIIDMLNENLYFADGTAYVESEN